MAKGGLGTDYDRRAFRPGVAFVRVDVIAPAHPQVGGRHHCPLLRCAAQAHPAQARRSAPHRRFAARLRIRPRRLAVPPAARGALAMTQLSTPTRQLTMKTKYLL